MLRFLHHFLTSNSRHGTHSPFVYDLADSVIYNKKFAEAFRQEKRSSNLIKGEYLSRAISKKMIANHQDLKYSYPFMDNNAQITIDIVDFKESDLESLADCRFLQINNIYANGRNLEKWKSIIANPKVHVSIDLFYFGLLFHRPQQRKENFKLRYPFWIYGF